MAQTRGFVQRLKLTSPIIIAWVYIGPAANDTELLLVMAPNELTPEEAVARGAMVDALGAALVSHQQVQAFHADNSAEITMLQIPPPALVSTRPLPPL